MKHELHQERERDPPSEISVGDASGDGGAVTTPLQKGLVRSFVHKSPSKFWFTWLSMGYIYKVAVGSISNIVTRLSSAAQALPTICRADKIETISLFHMTKNYHEYKAFYFYHPQTKLWEGNVFTGVCGGGYVQGVGYSSLPPRIHGTWYTPVYGRQAGGTHATGMFSC